LDWLRRYATNLVISPIVLGELEYGILLLPAGRRRRQLFDWFAVGVKRLYVVPVDAATANEWAKLVAELHRKGRAMPVKDSLIAATARQHGMTIATRNVAHFRHSGVPIVNPFASK
jgi:predicted nucleic acid-binding protein